MRELALHILDILRNAVDAGAANVSLTIEEDEPADRLTITVTDDGRGMDAETVARVTNPFFTTRTTRHVGLGLPLLAAAAERCEGGLRIESAPGQGTVIVASFRLSHPDRQPLGNLAETLLAFLLSDGAPTLRYLHRVIRNPFSRRKRVSEIEVSEVEFSFDTAEICAELGDVPLTNLAVVQWLSEFLTEGEAELAE
jgi:anti-sigma regulatory factor (Ser/Thr protein kinase)